MDVTLDVPKVEIDPVVLEKTTGDQRSSLKFSAQ